MRCAIEKAQKKKKKKKARLVLRSRDVDLRSADLATQAPCRVVTRFFNGPLSPRDHYLYALASPAVLTAVAHPPKLLRRTPSPAPPAMSPMTALGVAMPRAPAMRRSRQSRRLVRVSTRAVSTGTSVDTRAVTRTNPKVVISQTKRGEIRYSFGTPPDLRPGRAVPEAPPGPDDSGEEMRRYAVLDCDGGMAATGLVLTRGPDDLLMVARVYPGGSAEGVLIPGDVILACSVVVNVEDDGGDFVPEFRWHDSAESSAEHTLGILMTHDGELRLRVCRNYQPKMERAVRAAWGELVPTTVARNVRETWSRLLYRRKPTKAPAEDAQDASIGGIWKNLFTVGSGRDVRGDARRCWAEVLKVDASAAVQAAEEEPKQAPEREVVCVLAEAEVDEDVADDEDVVAEVVVDEVVKAEEEDVESDEDVQENAIEEEARSQKTWEELEVTLDCTAGVNMTGLQFAQRDDGLLRVSVCKPGGTASKKVRLNDVLLATTYVVMVPDPTGERRAGVPELEWMDAVREGHSFNTLQEAMLTHSQEMKLRLARGDVPLGALAATSASVSAPPEESPAAEAERRYREAESAREMAKKSMRAAAAAGAEVPEDIKAWAAKIAAEARATRGA